MSRELVANLFSAHDRRIEIRDGYEDLQQKACDFVNPRRYDLAGTRTKGAQRLTKMYDGTAQDAFHDWVAGMLGWGVSEAAEQWHKAAIPLRRYRDMDSAQRYCQDYTEQMGWEFSNSNFYDCNPEYLQDAGSIGTGTINTDESADLQSAEHRVCHPGRIWIAEGARGKRRSVDTVDELITMTAREVLQTYNKEGDRVPEIVRKWAKDAASALSEVDLLQTVLPGNDPSIFDRRYTWKKWAIVTVLYAVHGRGAVTSEQINSATSGDRLIRVQGIDYFPYTVWRFRKNSDEVYGYSPAMDVMCAIEAAQNLGYNLQNLANLASSPMLNAPEEMRTEFSRLPGSTNWYGGENRRVEAVKLGGEYPIGVDREDRIHDLIRKRYGYHVWNAVLGLQAKKERVQATEVLEVRADQARLIVGQFDNFWRQGIEPVYDNVAFIAGRAGRLPEPPAELQDAAGSDIVKVKFVGPLRMLQAYATKISAVQAAMAFLNDLATAVGRHVSAQMAAQVYARIKLPDLAEYICDQTDFPQSIMRSDEEVEAMIEGIDQRTLAAEQAKNAREIAAAAGALGKPVDRTSLLTGAAA